jgi:hypothetical protein
MGMHERGPFFSLRFGNIHRLQLPAGIILPELIIFFAVSFNINDQALRIGPIAVRPLPGFAADFQVSLKTQRGGEFQKEVFGVGFAVAQGAVQVKYYCGEVI